MRFRRLLFALCLTSGAAACALSVQQTPGCHADDECPEGFFCRSGACFDVTTGLSDPVDAGDAGDAAGE